LPPKKKSLPKSDKKLKEEKSKTMTKTPSIKTIATDEKPQTILKIPTQENL
jgi:hypothetical protein